MVSIFHCGKKDFFFTIEKKKKKSWNQLYCPPMVINEKHLVWVWTSTTILKGFSSSVMVSRSSIQDGGEQKKVISDRLPIFETSTFEELEAAELLLRGNESLNVQDSLYSLMIFPKRLSYCWPRTSFYDFWCCHYYSQLGYEDFLQKSFIFI